MCTSYSKPYSNPFVFLIRNSQVIIIYFIFFTANPFKYDTWKHSVFFHVNKWERRRDEQTKEKFALLVFKISLYWSYNSYNKNSYIELKWKYFKKIVSKSFLLLFNKWHPCLWHSAPCWPGIRLYSILLVSGPAPSYFFFCFLPPPTTSSLVSFVPQSLRT